MSKSAMTSQPAVPATPQASVSRRTAPPAETGLSDAEASRLIRAYVAEHPGSDAFDIGVALGLPWRRVRRLASDLVSQGQLAEQE